MSTKNSFYVVTRGGHRVSDQIYPDKVSAKVEFDHWAGIVNRLNDGTTVELVPVDENGRQTD